MNKFLKIAFLIITLAIPLAIFLFLRFFGENKFDIPVYYEQGVDDEVTNCDNKGKPFSVPDTLVARKGASLVIFFLEGGDFNAMSLDNHVRRLQDIFGERLPEIIVYSSRTSLPENDIHLKNLPEDVLKNVMQCGFIVDDFNRYILVDRKRRIRGYYGTELDEMDRLIVEMKILLENGAN